MKKKLALILGVAAAMCLCVGVLAGCGGAANSSSSSSDASASASSAASSEAGTEATTLVVGFDKAYPPYGYVGNDGEYTGVDLDLAKEVCDRLGWEFKAEPIDWDAKDALIDQGNITCIWNGFTYEGREDSYAFSGQYMLNAQVIVVKAGSDIKTLADLADKTVITQVDSAALEALDSDEWKDLQASFKGGKAQTISDYNNAFMQLESGTVDAVACDLSIAAYQMAAKPDVFTQLDEQLSAEHYAVGFKKGEEGQALADQVTEALKAMDKDGKVKEICDKYADQGVSYANWCLK
jgi:polar amino acid transport system substrate-binding protein